jgi:cyanophycinase
MPSDPAAGPVFLIGGGWDQAEGHRLYGAFLAACDATRPQVACVVLDEGDGTEQFGRWAGALSGGGACDPVPVLVPEGEALDVAALGDADAVLICGGLTPAYAAALTPARQPLPTWLARRHRRTPGSPPARRWPRRGPWSAGGSPAGCRCARRRLGRTWST